MYLCTCPCAADLCPILLVAHGSTCVDGRTQTRCGHCLQLRLVAMVGTNWRSQPANTRCEELLLPLAHSAQGGDGVGEAVAGWSRLGGSERGWG